MIPQNELPREKLVKNGVSSLSDQELLCLILRSGTRKNDIYALSHRIIAQVGGISGLGTARLGELLAIEGVKLAKASSIIAAIELGRRSLQSDKNARLKVNSMQEIYQLIKPYVADPYQEQTFLVCLNARKEVISSVKLFKGSASGQQIHPRDIFREAVRNNAEYIVLAHNHPSGDVTPSSTDIKTTRFIAKLGGKLGIKVVDHLIVGGDTFLSMRLRGYF